MTINQGVIVYHMTLNEYQQEALKTATSTIKGNLNYMVLGLTNEAGEVAGKLKKFLRGDYDIEKTRDMLIDETGDCLWYLSGIASSLGITLDELAQRNLDKLSSRQSRGVIQGDGDKR